jgi:hypothetical protein
MENPRGFRAKVKRPDAVRSASAKATAGLAPLWTCPKCGQKFVGRNMWHSCGLATLDDWKQRMGPRARALYDKFELMIAASGEYYVAPAKTRIAFMGRVRFAGISRINEKEMICNFALSKPLTSTRFFKVEEIVPGWFAHRMRITDPAQLDAQVQRWIKRAYRTMGTHGLQKKARR